LRCVGCRDCGVDAAVAPRMGESLPRGRRQVSTIMRFRPVYAGLRGSVAVSWSVCRAFPRSTLHQAESLPDHEACRCGPAGHRTPPPQAGPLSQVTDGSRPYRARNPATRAANSIYSGMNTNPDEYAHSSGGRAGRAHAGAPAGRRGSARPGEQEVWPMPSWPRCGAALSDSARHHATREIHDHGDHKSGCHDRDADEAKMVVRLRARNILSR
jgi:hypothetical protein